MRSTVVMPRGRAFHVPKPMPPECRPLYDLLWHALGTQQKVNHHGARVFYPQALRSAAKRLYAEGWRVTEPQ